MDAMELISVYITTWGQADKAVQIVATITIGLVLILGTVVGAISYYRHKRSEQVNNAREKTSMVPLTAFMAISEEMCAQLRGLSATVDHLGDKIQSLESESTKSNEQAREVQDSVTEIKLELSKLLLYLQTVQKRSQPPQISERSGFYNDED